MVESLSEGVMADPGIAGGTRPRRKHAPEYKLTVASKLENLAKIGNFVTQTGAQLGLPPDFMFEVQVAAEEACTNVIQHAYKLRADRPISVGCRFRNRELVVRVRDFGRPFDPETVASPKVTAKLGQRRLNGLGIFLIKKLMNRAKYRFDEKRGNELTMIKRLPDLEATPNGSQNAL
jgi:serine/threonine-protein kinase RsbW